MNLPDDTNPTAEWIAAQVRSGDRLADANDSPEAAGAVADDARLLDQTGGHATLSTQPANNAKPREVLPHLDVGRFEILRLVGRGGMGNVFLAIDPVLQRKVARKLPRLDLRGEPQLKQRFLREAQAMAGLSHPNLVQILEVGEDGPSLFLVLAWCVGR